MGKTIVFSIELNEEYRKNPHKATRHTWGSFRPTERVVESKKRYNRKAWKAELKTLLDEQ